MQGKILDQQNCNQLESMFSLLTIAFNIGKAKMECVKTPGYRLQSYSVISAVDHHISILAHMQMGTLGSMMFVLEYRMITKSLAEQNQSTVDHLYV